MKSYLSIFPHCYAYTEDHCIFIYNPDNKRYCILDNCKNIEDFKQNRVLLINNQAPSIDDFVKKCIADGLGYIYESETEIPPINISYNLKFVSSISKMKNALGYNNGLYVLNYVTSLDIYTSNTKLIFQNDCVYRQISYPAENTFRFTDLNVLKSIRRFPNLKEIRICGDYDDCLIRNLTELYPSCILTIRTKFQISDFEEIRTLLYQFNNIQIEFLLQTKDELNSFAKYYIDFDQCVSATVIVKSMKDYNSLEYCNMSFQVLPVIFDPDEQYDFCHELQLDVNDILSSTVTLDELYSREIFNTSMVGKLQMRQNGDVYCEDTFIENILADDLLRSMTDWLNNDNDWFLSRKKFNECKDCPLAALCPPVTMYERQGLLCKACRYSVKSDILRALER